MSDIGHAIRRARRAQGLTIKELAALAEVDETTVGRIERGMVKNPSSADKLQKILSIGIYTTTPTHGDKPHDPRVSEASFEELWTAALAAHGRELRGARDASEGARFDAIAELPPHIADRARNGTIPSDRDTPNGGNTSGL